MPPAFVLSQDQTLKFASAPAPKNILRHPQAQKPSPGIVRSSSVGIDFLAMHKQRHLNAAACASLPLTYNVKEQSHFSAPERERALYARRHIKSTLFPNRTRSLSRSATRKTFSSGRGRSLRPRPDIGRSLPDVQHPRSRNSQGAPRLETAPLSQGFCDSRATTVMTVSSNRPEMRRRPALCASGTTLTPGRGPCIFAHQGSHRSTAGKSVP
jgi:hypothetical protein